MLEARNIADAVAWLARSRRRDPMSVKTMRELHRRMFRDVWRWAGQFSREFNRRLGADANQIEPELVKLVDDALTWIETGSIDDPCELLAAFHHRLTRIHPFPNGNGRWARLMTDLLAEGIGHPPVNWGGAMPGAALHKAGTVARSAYFDALRSADGHDLRPLTQLIGEWSRNELPDEPPRMGT